jgi:hypothetical protein
VRLATLIPPLLLERLREQARLEDVPQTAIVRRALREVLGDEREDAPGSNGGTKTRRGRAA